MIEFIVEGDQSNIDEFISELREEGIDFRVVGYPDPHVIRDDL